MASSMICFRCGYEGHTAKYGTGKGTKNPVESPRGPDSGERTVQTCSQAKANASTSRDAGTSNTVVTGAMGVSLLKVLLRHISSFLQLSSTDFINLQPTLKYFHKIEGIFKLLRPILDAVVDSDIASDEELTKAFEELDHSIDELRALFENWQPLSSKVYFVLQSEALISKIGKSCLDIFQLFQSSNENLPEELSSSSLEHCVQKIKHFGKEEISSVIKDAIGNEVEGIAPSSDVLVKLADFLSLRSNQEILIEAVALEKLKESAEQAENTEEAEGIDQMIALVTHMHERFIMINQSQNSSPVSIPADFCCPLSLELMTDPVIVASGQTYERVFIKNWIDLGLNVCPKTRQTLVHTNLIPNYTVKALIANWCETNNVKLSDPSRSVNLNQLSPVLAGNFESDTHREPIFPHSPGYQPMSPQSTRSAGSGKNMNSLGVSYRDGSSSLLSHSFSEDSLSNDAGDEREIDVSRLLLSSSEDQMAKLEENGYDLVAKPSTSPSKANVPDTSGEDEPSHSHNRTASTSSAVSNTNLSQGTSGEPNESVSDAAGESKSEPLAATSTTNHREPDREHPPRLADPRSQGNTMWLRPSERFASKMIAPSANETRPDLSAIEAQVQKVVEELKSSSLETLRGATAELRLLARHNMDNRIVIAQSGAIEYLVDLLLSADSKLQENAVTALLNLSINDNNKNVIAQANAIEPLIHVLKTGSPEAKENSAATLFSLSVIEENKVKIGRSGAIGPLVELLGNGTPRGKKDAATALFNLSIFHENKARIVQAGAVRHLVELMDPAAGMVDKAVAVLANLTTIPEGRSAIGQEGGIPVLVEVVELGSGRGKENAAAALLQLCTTSSRHCSMVLQEGAVPPLVALSQSGTARAKEKAQALLSHFRSQRHGNSGRG
ncbi:U-box domain-containing protein 4-like isoform X1 [Cucurbita pepo subsp. pepo]|uniref:U-box domain-containing protein 4-like isoform X1 n=2 Tax=Cucurbita pepo subsp. pepo TaxID=3664 RepID=UPI000C9D27E4|nr:U-box domain-containing protein 4-like isoform X1 [Cucurbita pepo subsp. pepo]XP_023513137.1 U-box domain-containing protein 4-like isoform X1 [Cucurbita pepo subsp. pepo]